MIAIFLEYIWLPLAAVFVPVIFKIVGNRFLYIKEIKKKTSREINEFIDLYNTSIKDDVKICVEEIIYFIDNTDDDMEHHLYICKKFNKTVGFIKFMISSTQKIIFIAYAGIDKTDKTANKYGFKIMIKKLSKKYFKSKIADCIITEIERNPSGGYSTPLSKLIARYSSNFKKQSFFIDFDYIQPNMPDNNFEKTNELLLSLVYIPYHTKRNNIISKEKLLGIIHTIYFDIYCPSCNEVSCCDCSQYNKYLEEIMSIYRSDLPENINLIKM